MCKVVYKVANFSDNHYTKYQTREKIMETVQTAEPLVRDTPTFESVWALVKEVAESQKETDRILKENARRQEERDRQMKESAERLDKQLGKFGNRFGEMVEYMVMPNLVEKFRELGFVFTRASPHTVIKDKENNIYAQIDITLENGDKIMIVEVKSKPTTADITGHIERMEKVRAHADLHNDNRKYLGAVAGMVFNDNEKEFAMKNGFYVIEPSGETFTITEPNNNYSPREW
jgi:hypothetical protein